MTNNKPLVSISILTYNHKDYIENGLESILSQDYDNFEIIIGDDASTDGTQEILKKYKVMYPDKITLLLHEKNLGITNNCNTVLSLCKGKYFVAIGGDDQMLPSKLSIQVDYMENNQDCNMCYHNMEAFDLDTNKFLYYTHYDSSTGKRKRDNGTVKEAIKEGVFFSPVSGMIRMKNIPDGGYNERIPFASDYLFYVEVFAKGGSIEYIDNVLGRYGRGKNNITIKSRDIDYTLDLDMLDTCNILLVKYPQYHNEILYRYSEFLRGMRLKDKKNYFNWLKTSFKMSFNFKSLILLSIYFLSFGKVKK